MFGFFPGHITLFEVVASVHGRRCVHCPDCCHSLVPRRQMRAGVSLPAGAHCTGNAATLQFVLLALLLFSTTTRTHADQTSSRDVVETIQVGDDQDGSFP